MMLTNSIYIYGSHEKYKYHLHSCNGGRVIGTHIFLIPRERKENGKFGIYRLSSYKLVFCHGANNGGFVLYYDQAESSINQKNNLLNIGNKAVNCNNTRSRSAD